MFQKDKLTHLLEDRVTVGKGLEEPDLRSLKKEYDPRSLSDLIAWLETKAPAGKYDFNATGKGADGCLFARYAVHLGYEANFDGYEKLLQDFGTFPSDPFDRLAVSHPQTFGGALDRALVLQANASERLLPNSHLRGGVG